MKERLTESDQPYDLSEALEDLEDFSGQMGDFAILPPDKGEPVAWARTYWRWFERNWERMELAIQTVKGHCPDEDEEEDETPLTLKHTGDPRVDSAIAEALAIRQSGGTKKSSSEQESSIQQPETLDEIDKQIRNTHVAELIFGEWSERHMPVCGTPRRREVIGMILEDLKSGIPGMTIIKCIKDAKINTPYERISETLKEKVTKD